LPEIIAAGNRKVAVESRVTEVLANFMHTNKEISLSNNLRNDLGADSLDLVEICMFIEEEFSIEITGDKAEEMETVEDYVNYICSLNLEE